VGSLKGFSEVMLEFVIGEVSCLITTPDQVHTRLGLRVKVVDECPQSTANPVANNRIADLSADRVGHIHRWAFRRAFDETDS
jgi:hypothetical protein